jgi:hypothetical protein
MHFPAASSKRLSGLLLFKGGGHGRAIDLPERAMGYMHA